MVWKSSLEEKASVLHSRKNNYKISVIFLILKMPHLNFETSPSITMILFTAYYSAKKSSSFFMNVPALSLVTNPSPLSLEWIFLVFPSARVMMTSKQPVLPPMDLPSTVAEGYLVLTAFSTTIYFE